MKYVLLIAPESMMQHRFKFRTILTGRTYFVLILGCQFFFSHAETYHFTANKTIERRIE